MKLSRNKNRGGKGSSAWIQYMRPRAEAGPRRCPGSWAATCHAVIEPDSRRCEGCSTEQGRIRSWSHGFVDSGAAATLLERCAGGTWSHEYQDKTAPEWQALLGVAGLELLFADLILTGYGDLIENVAPLVFTGDPADHGAGATLAYRYDAKEDIEARDNWVIHRVTPESLASLARTLHAQGFAWTHRGLSLADEIFTAGSYIYVHTLPSGKVVIEPMA